MLSISSVGYEMSLPLQSNHLKVDNQNLEFLLDDSDSVSDLL